MARALTCLVLLSVLLVACGGVSKTMIFENASDQEVTVRVNDRLRLLVKPGETKSFNTPNNKGDRRVVIIDARGDVKLDKVYAWDELEVSNFRFVIR